MSTGYRGKRLLDVAAAATAGALFLPVAAAIAAAIKLEDGGPVLFVQTRVGRRRRPFAIVKFRSMRDGRVTGVGRWLRRTGLDELPQFLNVLRGDMSMVGPRPLTAADLARLGWGAAALDWRFAARPGITGPAQLLAGHGADASRALDRRYLAEQSLPGDVRLLAWSVAANLLGKRRVARWLQAGTASARDIAL